MTLNIGGVEVGITSTEVLPLDTTRRWFALQNTGVQDAFIAVGMDAEVDKGIMIERNDGAVTLERTPALTEIFENPLNAIVAQGTTTIIFLEE